MAIAFDACSDRVGSFASTSNTVPHTCTGSDLILFAGVAIQASGSITVTATYNGVPMTEVGNVANGTSVRSYLFYLLAPDTGANDIVFTLSASCDSFANGISYTGVKQSNQPDSSGTATTTGTNDCSKALTSTADNCWMVSYVGTPNSFTPTAISGTTLRGTQNIALFCDSEDVITPAGSKTVGFSHPESVSSAIVAATFATANIKTYDGLAQTSVKTIDGLAIASVKSWNGLT